MKMAMDRVCLVIAVIVLQAAANPVNIEDDAETRTLGLAVGAAGGAAAAGAAALVGATKLSALGILPPPPFPLPFAGGQQQFLLPGQQQFFLPGFGQQGFIGQQGFVGQQGLVGQQQWFGQPQFFQQQQPQFFQQQPQFFQQQPQFFQQQPQFFQQQPQFFQQQPQFFQQQQQPIVFQQTPQFVQQPQFIQQRPPQVIQQPIQNIEDVIDVPAIQDEFGNWFQIQTMPNGEVVYTFIPPELIRAMQDKSGFSKRDGDSSKPDLLDDVKEPTTTPAPIQTTLSAPPTNTPRPLKATTVKVQNAEQAGGMKKVTVPVKSQRES